MSDSRIKEFIDEYHKAYLVAYSVKPMITGKEAKRVQDMFKWVDDNTIDQMKIYDALWNFFNDQGFVKEQAHPLELFFKGITKYMQPVKKTPEQHGLEMIEKAKAMFAQSQVNLEERFKVVPNGQEELLEQFGKLYPQKDHETALRWAKGHRYTYAQSDLIKDEASLVYKRWIDHGKLAKIYFGEELLKKVWNETKPTPVEDRKEMLKKQIKTLTIITDKVV